MVDIFVNSKQNIKQKCRSKSYIDKWFSDKTVMVYIKEKWVKYDDFEMPIQEKFELLDF